MSYGFRFIILYICLILFNAGINILFNIPYTFDNVMASIIFAGFVVLFDYLDNEKC